MAKNDWNVVICRILAYLRSCLQDGVSPDDTQLSAEALGINAAYRHNILQMLSAEGLIQGAFTTYDNHQFERPANSISITLKGLEYLQDSSTMQRVLKTLTFVRGLLPGF